MADTLEEKREAVETSGTRRRAISRGESTRKRIKEKRRLHRQSGRCSSSNMVLHLFIHTVGFTNVNGIGSAACAYIQRGTLTRGKRKRDKREKARERREKENGRHAWQQWPFLGPPLFSRSNQSFSAKEGLTQSHGEGEGEDGAGGRDAVTSTGTTERDGMIIGKGDGGEKIARETPVERTGSLMRNRGSGIPSGGRGGAGDGGGRRGGRGGWLPWLPETAVAATDDARGVTDSWQSYRAPTRTSCVSTYVTYIYLRTCKTHTHVRTRTHVRSHVQVRVRAVSRVTTNTRIARHCLRSTFPVYRCC